MRLSIVLRIRVTTRIPYSTFGPDNLYDPEPLFAKFKPTVGEWKAWDITGEFLRDEPATGNPVDAVVWFEREYELQSPPYEVLNYLTGRYGLQYDSDATRNADADETVFSSIDDARNVEYVLSMQLEE